MKSDKSISLRKKMHCIVIQNIEIELSRNIIILNQNVKT